MSLRDDFGGDFSSSAFRVIDDELRIVGKWGQIAEMDGYYDVWLVREDGEPMGTLKLRRLCQNTPFKTPPTELTGEGWGRVAGRDDLLKTAHLLKVRKKRKVSAQERARLADIRRGHGY
jgi:hypothetical protein